MPAITCSHRIIRWRLLYRSGMMTRPPVWRYYTPSPDRIKQFHQLCHIRRRQLAEVVLTHIGRGLAVELDLIGHKGDERFNRPARFPWWMQDDRGPRQEPAVDVLQHPAGRRGIVITRNDDLLRGTQPSVHRDQKLGKRVRSAG